MTLHACNLRPLSRGWITLRSADPTDAPRIQPNYLAETKDIAVLREAVKISRDIFAAAPFRSWRGREIFPGESVSSDAALDDFIRRRAETVYHPAVWARTPMPSWIRNFAFTVSMACAWWMPRSCRH
jgi:choline dehydrogenase